MKLKSNYLVSTLLFVTAWLVTYFLVVIVFKDSEAKVAYGLLSAWWCGLYISHVFRFKVNVAIGALVVYVVYAMLAVIFNLPWGYHDLLNTMSISYILFSLSGAIIFCSPILIDSLIRKFITA